MKKLMLVIAIVVTSCFCSAQEPLSFEFVIQKEGVTAGQIYNKLVDWITTSFKAVDGDFYRDKDEKVITKDVRFDFSTGKLMTVCYDGVIRYKLKFQCRDGRFKMLLTNFEHSNNPKYNSDCVLGLLLTEPVRGANGRFDEKVWETAKNKCEEIANSLKQDMEKMTFETENDNW